MLICGETCFALARHSVFPFSILLALLLFVLPCLVFLYFFLKIHVLTAVLNFPFTPPGFSFFSAFFPVLVHGRRHPAALLLHVNVRLDVRRGSPYLPHAD